MRGANYMTISSSAFSDGDEIPAKYTCDGGNNSLPITNSDIPDGTKSLTLVMEDLDAPTGLFTHWIIYNMSPTTLQLMENEMPLIGTHGLNDFGSMQYGGPCPPQGSGKHRYYVRLYALDIELALPEGVKRPVLNSALEGHVIDSTHIMGTYGKE
jgi:Raf kinase inhibitor-like YbhB/YbcL family protein